MALNSTTKTCCQQLQCKRRYVLIYLWNFCSVIICIDCTIVWNDCPVPKLISLRENILPACIVTMMLPNLNVPNRILRFN